MNNNIGFEVILYRVPDEGQDEETIATYNKNWKLIERWSIESNNVDDALSKSAKNIELALNQGYRLIKSTAPLPRFKSYQYDVIMGQDRYKLLFLDLDVKGQEFVKLDEIGLYCHRKLGPLSKPRL